MMKKIFLLTIILGMAVSVWIAGAKSQNAGNSGKNVEITHENRMILAPLLNAGIEINEDSLIQVVIDRNKWRAKNVSIVWNAAGLLGSFPKTDRGVQVLMSITNDKDEMLVFMALGSLCAWRDEAGIDLAVKRLSTFNDADIRIQLANVLAKAGRSEGWAELQADILDERYTQFALEHVDHFDGLRDEVGQPIDVNAELTRLSSFASKQSQRLIREKVDRRIKEQAERQPRKNQ